MLYYKEETYETGGMDASEIPCIELDVTQPIITNTDKKVKKDYVKWVKISERGFRASIQEKELQVVPPGVYEIKWTKEYGLILNGKDICLDELFILPSPEHNKILKDIRTFWERKSYFNKYKYTYKRGILLYGPAGTGKTSVINLIAKELVKNNDGIVLYLNSSRDLESFISFVPIIRQIEPDKQILCVMEDIEEFTNYRENETLLLNVLDGMNQMDNIVYLATTNFPENLKERILNRPSRFDRRYELGLPNDEVREEYFKLKLTSEDLEVIDLKNGLKRQMDFQ